MKHLKGLFLILLLALLTAATSISCNKDDESDTGSSGAVIAALTCASAGFSATPVSGAAFSGTAVVPYTGGNAAGYGAGAAIASTGVTGLTATLQGGTLASGAGNLTYAITGTPAAAGTANFAISFGGQTCTISIPVSATAAANDCSGLTGAAKVACLAEAFKATLTAAQIASLQLSLTKANAIKWSNLPGGVSIRNGLEFSSLSATQLAAALAVIEAAAGTTANEGYNEFNQIRAADDVLGATGASGYASNKYIIAFLGAPSATGTWMLQFGGHHYAQNVTFSGGAVVSGTPSHQGVEPRSWTSGSTTYAPLAQEATAMAEMLASLSAQELASAKTTTTFSDVLLGPSKDGQFPATKVGIKVGTLSTAVQAKVLAAIVPWINDLNDTFKANLLTIYTNELADTYITYSGNANGASGNAASFFTANTDYARIDGPSVWIEFVCQNGVVMSGIHYHTIFRDHTRDYNGL